MAMRRAQNIIVMKENMNATWQAPDAPITRPRSVDCTAFTRNGHKILSTSVNSLSIIDIQSRACVRTIIKRDWIMAVISSPTMDIFITVCDKGLIDFHSDNGDLLCSVSTHHPFEDDAMCQVAFSPDGQILLLLEPGLSIIRCFKIHVPIKYCAPHRIYQSDPKMSYSSTKQSETRKRKDLEPHHHRHT